MREVFASGDRGAFQMQEVRLSSLGRDGYTAAVVQVEMVHEDGSVVVVTGKGALNGSETG